MRPRHLTATALAALAVAITATIALAGPAAAHPLGNFTVNTYSGIVVHADGIDVTFVLDMAEIPAFQERSQIDTDGDGRVSGAEGSAYRSSACRRALAKVDLKVDERPVALALGRTALGFPPGQAGLDTLRLSCAMRAPLADVEGRTVTYRSENHTDRTGWREITAAGDGVTLVDSTVRTRTISGRLTRYPTGLLQSPLDQRSASFGLRAGGPRLAPPASSGEVVAPLPRGVDRATKAFTSYVGRQDLSLGFALVGVALSVLLGAVHALAPGHGKTVMAAYLVGQQGSLRQAGLIAATVTVTHTAGVLVLGLAISASAVVAPERLYPWLGLLSGLMLAAIGVGLLARIRRARRHAGAHARAGVHDHAHSGAGVHDHAAEPAHDHAEPSVHSHGGRAHSHGPLGDGQPLTWGSLLAMGFVGGFLPSPSAVVVLLGAVALGRAWFGAVLVVAYGLGMALTLTAAGLLLVRTRGALHRRYLRSDRVSRLATFNRLLPPLTGVAIVVVGLVLAAQGLTQI